MAKKEEGISENAVHTKGPFHFEFDADGDHAIFAGTKLIAVTVGLDHFSREEDEANAALLAAAEDMFEALNRMLVSYVGEEDWCMECGGKIGEDAGCETCYVIKKAMEALAKARGEQR